MSLVWKILALLLVVTALVWLTTLWRWESVDHDPSSTDLLLNLVLLPLGLAAGLVLVVWAVRRLRRYAMAPSLAAAGSASADAAGTAAVLAPERLRAKLLASALQVRAGGSWQSAARAIGSGDCKPTLDPNITDDYGVGVFTAPMDDLDTEALAAALAAKLATLSQAAPEAWAGYETPPEVLRALTLMQDTLTELREVLDAQWPALAPRPATAPPLRGASAALPAEVSLRVGIPASWPAATQKLATAWIEAQLQPLLDAAQAAALGDGLGAAPALRPVLHAHVHAMDSAEAFWQLGEQQMQPWLRQKQAGLLLLLAADSAISADAVGRLAAQGDLFSGANARGRVPGEGAAAVLLATPDWPSPAATPGAPPPLLAWLHSARLLRRDKSADASGRVSPAVLLHVATDAVEASGWGAASIGHLTTDADHRASRAGELFETVQTLLPDLDPTEQVLRLGVGCGDLGLARLLACVGLAARQVNESQKTALVLGTFPAFERCAVLLTATAEPAPAATPDAAAAAAAT